MQYNHRRRGRYSRRSVLDYFLPFLVIFIGGLFIYYVFNLFFGQDYDLLRQSKLEVEFYIESGSAEVMFAEQDSWHSAIDGVKLFQSEKVRTDLDSKAKLIFIDQTILRLDQKTELEIEKLSKGVDERNNNVLLSSGRIWANISYTANQNSGTRIKTPFLEVISNGAIFALNTNTISVIDGSADVNIWDSATAVILKSVTVGIGQELTVDDQIIQKIKDGEDRNLLAAFSDTLKETAWYKWNQQEDAQLEDIAPLSEAEEESIAEEEQPEDADLTEQNGSDPDEDGAVLTVTEPELSNDKAVISEKEIFITGTATSQVAKIKVNNYTLQKFSAGDDKWNYKASLALGNLKKGENIYEIEAYDEDDEEIMTKEINIYYEEEESPDDQEESEDEDEEETEVRTDNLKLAILEPNKGEDMTTEENSVIISGTASKETAYVKVNNYRLQAYSPGDKEWQYRANTDLGNLKKGENIYEVIAYDEDDSEISKLMMVITYEPSTEEEEEVENSSAEETIDQEADPEEENSGATDEASSDSADEEELPKTDDSDEESSTETESAGLTVPVITFPSSDPTYETTLEPITIGGTCSTATIKIYVNDTAIPYIAGSDNWSKTVQLNSGENIFRVRAEDKDGNVSEASSIVITFE